MRISFILVEQFIWKTGTACISVPFWYHKGQQIDKKSYLFAWGGYRVLWHSGLCKINFQLFTKWERARQDARTEAVQGSPPGFSHPCLQAGTDLWPHPAGCVLTLSLKQSSALCSYCHVRVWDDSHSVTSIKCIKPVLRKVSRKMNAFKIGWCFLPRCCWSGCQGQQSLENCLPAGLGR